MIISELNVRILLIIFDLDLYLSDIIIICFNCCIIFIMGFWGFGVLGFWGGCGVYRDECGEYRDGDRKSVV